MDLEVFDDAEQNETIKSKKNFLTSASIPRWPHGCSHKDLIQQKRFEYVHREANEFEQALDENMEREDENDISDTNIEYDQDKNEFLIYEMGNNEGDIFIEMGLSTRTEKVEHFNVPKQVPNGEY